ncbi:hypothetical protein [Flavobacterium covae]|uniref:hypothetical protein n=1 Tax=Flavobacterium covae TaxID=2906076 RepID=UPI000745B344|nr:hypothetical protein [Flavobacterium covae]AMA48987.1 hypothetical protein AWN65_05670 [Flavobacterium covae]MCJ1809906.1 hypothetical protein [Flavobacterium covae]
MYKKTLLLLVFCFSCLLISCRTTRQEIQKTDSQTKVTTEKSITYKDTTLVAPKAETSIKIPLSELGFKNDLKTISKPINYSQKNGQAKVKIKIVHDTIYATATCDSLAIRAQIKSELTKEMLKESKSDTASEKSKTGYSFFDLIWAFVIGFGICYLLKTFKIL